MTRVPTVAKMASDSTPRSGFTHGRNWLAPALIVPIDAGNSSHSAAVTAARANTVGTK